MYKLWNFLFFKYMYEGFEGIGCKVVTDFGLGLKRKSKNVKTPFCENVCEMPAKIENS